MYKRQVKDYATYRAYYCGVCRGMGRLYSGLCGLVLSYESTFIAILLSALSPNKVKLEHHACLANPIRKKAMVVDNEQAVSYTHLAISFMINGIVKWYQVWIFFSDIFPVSYTHLEKELQQAQSNFMLASAVMSPEVLEESVMFPTRRPQLKVGVRTIMNVDVPKLDVDLDVYKRQIPPQVISK